jgi:hypothetical protein
MYARLAKNSLIRSGVKIISATKRGCQGPHPSFMDGDHWNTLVTSLELPWEITATSIFFWLQLWFRHLLPLIYNWDIMRWLVAVVVTYLNRTGILQLRGAAEVPLGITKAQ